MRGTGQYSLRRAPLPTRQTVEQALLPAARPGLRRCCGGRSRLLPADALWRAGPSGTGPALLVRQVAWRTGHAVARTGPALWVQQPMDERASCELRGPFAERAKAQFVELAEHLLAHPGAVSI